MRKIADSIEESAERPADLVSYQGQGKFAIILPNTNTIGSACVAEKIRKQVESLQIANSQSKISNYITLSLGVASNIPSPNNSPKILITAVEETLERAKKLGKNRKIIWINSDSELETINN